MADGAEQVTDFERGKQLLLEGLEEFIRLYFSYLKAIEGLKLHLEDPQLITLGLNSLLSSIREAKSPDEIQESIRQTGEFWKLLGVTRAE